MVSIMDSNLDLGTVYLLSNPAMPGIYKIGLTRRSVGSRIESLRSTSLPLDFVSICEVGSEYALQLEKFIHRKLKSNRVSRNREFFSFANDKLAEDKFKFKSIAKTFKPRKYTEDEVKKLSRETAGSASKEVKAIGLKSLQYVADNSDTPRNTLHLWYKSHYDRFIVIVHGVKAMQDGGLIK